MHTHTHAYTHTHHFTKVSPSFFGQSSSSKVVFDSSSSSAAAADSSLPVCAGCPSRGICSTSFDRIPRWCDDLMAVDDDTSVLGENLEEYGQSVGRETSQKRWDGGQRSGATVSSL